jgi:hypothetical protein
VLGFVLMLTQVGEVAPVKIAIHVGHPPQFLGEASHFAGRVFFREGIEMNLFVPQDVTVQYAHPLVFRAQRGLPRPA